MKYLAQGLERSAGQVNTHMLKVWPMSPKMNMVINQYRVNRTKFPKGETADGDFSDFLDLDRIFRISGIFRIFMGFSGFWNLPESSYFQGSAAFFSVLQPLLHVFLSFKRDVIQLFIRKKWIWGPQHSWRISYWNSYRRDIKELWCLFFFYGSSQWSQRWAWRSQNIWSNYFLHFYHW